MTYCNWLTGDSLLFGNPGLPFSIYNNLIPREEVLQLLAKELLLNDVLRTNSSLLSTLLTLERSSPKESDGIKLGQIKSAEVRIENKKIDSLGSYGS